MDIKVRVLLIEDNPHSAFFVEEVLTDASGLTVSFELLHVKRLAEGLDRLAEGGIDVVLLDLSLPDSQGLETFSQLHAKVPDVPVVVLSHYDDEALAIRALGRGAQDYLVKGQVSGNSLARTIRYAIERVRAEKALRESEERFQHLVEQAADAFFVSDSEGRIVDVNRRACDSLGYTRDQLLSLSLSDIDEGLAPEGVVALWKQMSPGQPITLDGVHRRGDGTTFPVESRIGLFESGGRQLMLFLSRDVTERKWAEDAVRQYTAELEARAEELDAFAHTVAHDLKGPLGYMVGFASVLEQDHAALPDEELRRYLHTIVRSGHKMGNIIDELLVLAGVRMIEEVPLQPLNMADIVAEALARVDHMARQHHAEILLPQRWHPALGYGPWIEEVWVNYLSNAIKYGGEPPRVELGSTLKNGSAVRFWVRDNGSGLTPEEQARLFTPFERLNWYRSRGQGLGLSIVRRIVDRLGGEVGVESQVLRGSEFYFLLPTKQNDG